jgi:hypothetical protein
VVHIRKQGSGALTGVDGSGDVVHLLRTTTGDNCPHEAPPQGTERNQMAETPADNPLVWGAISARDMANVESVDTHSKIIGRNQIKCEVVATYRTPPGSPFAFAQETVYTASSIAQGQRAAGLFRDACAALARLQPVDGGPGDPPPPATREPAPQTYSKTNARAA